MVDFKSFFTNLFNAEKAGIWGSVGIGALGALATFALVKDKPAYKVNDIIDDMVNALIMSISNFAGANAYIQAFAGILPAMTGLGNIVADALVPYESKDDALTGEKVGTVCLIVGVAVAILAYTTGGRKIGRTIESAYGNFLAGGN